jgi:hypothetical protein
MSTEELAEQAEEEVVAETPEVEAEAPEGGEGEKPADKPQTKTEIETLALEMGWDPKKSKSAADWIRDGTVIQRDLKASKDAQAKEFQQRIDRLDRTTKLALQRQRQQIEAEWQAKSEEAVDLADKDLYRRAEKGKREALAEFDKEVEELPAVKSDKAPDDAPPEVKAFAKRNSWFDVDEDMTDVAVNISKRLLSKYPDMPLAERLEQVEAEIKRKFPHEFNGQTEAKPQGAKPPAVEGGLRPIKTTTAKGWAQLPPEAKEFANSLIKDGLFDKDPEKARAKYAAEYFSQPGA